MWSKEEEDEWVVGDIQGSHSVTRIVCGWTNQAEMQALLNIMTTCAKQTLNNRSAIQQQPTPTHHG